MNDLKLSIEERLQKKVEKLYGKNIAEADNTELYYSLLVLTKELLADKPVIQGEKKIYYIS